MSFGSRYGDEPVPHGGMLASEADREATQAVLKQAFEDERLTQDEFEARVGSAVAARTQGELARLTRDLPSAPAPPPAAGRRPPPRWLLPTGIAAVALAGVIIALVLTLGSGPARQAAAAPSGAASDAGQGPSAPAPNPPAASGPARCPVGTSATALAIANALAGDPVYVDPGSSLLTAAQAGRLRAQIGQADPGRIRLAVLRPATVRHGGGERALTNAVASCPADSPGVTLVTTATAAYLVTSYADDQATTHAVGAALNVHSSLAGGLKDAVHRMALIDPHPS